MSEKGHIFTIKPEREVMEREKIVELMKQGKVVAIDKKSGEYVKKAFGVKLATPEDCIAGCCCARKK